MSAVAKSMCGKAGIVLAVVIGILVATVVHQWDRRENAYYNVAALLQPLFFPPITNVLHKSVEEQRAHLDKITQKMQQAVTKGQLRLAFDPKIAEASHGENKTRVVQLTVPSVSDPGHVIPVTCTCPHSATSSSSSLPLVLYFFGGGLILGSVQAELHLARYLASEADSVVCAMDYRLAPLHPYPAGVNDALQASLAIINKDVDLETLLDVKVDMSRIATWGMSAGGYMSAHTARLLAYYHDDFVDTSARLVLQVSLVPMAKPHGGTRSCTKYYTDKFWNGAINSYAWSAYLPDDDGRLAHNWRVSLLADPPQDTVARLPPTYVQINTRDILRDEGEMYAQRLQAQGKLVELTEYDTTHVGAAPAFAGGGGAGAFEHALDVLIRHLSSKPSHNVT